MESDYMESDYVYACSLDDAQEEMPWAAVVVRVETDDYENLIKYRGFKSIQEYERWVRWQGGVK